MAELLPPGSGLVVLLPDALRQGLVPPIGAYLAARGLTPVAVRSVALSADDTAAMYGDRLRSRTSESGRRHGPTLTRALFALDNSLVVLLRGGRGIADAPKRIHDLKGPSSFLQRRPGSLRMLSDVEDRCMSLLHTPDDAVQTAEHARHFFPEPLLAGLRGAPPIDWELVEDCRALGSADPHASRYASVIRLLLRVVSVSEAHALDGGLAPESRALARKGLHEWLVVRPTTGEDEHRRFTEVVGAVRTYRWSDCPPREPAAQAAATLIELLVDPEGYSFDRAEQVVELLRSLELRLTDFEKHWLRVTLTFFHE